MTGIEMIAAERERQISREGWTPEHDDHHGSGELADAAVCYAGTRGQMVDPPGRWPWSREWWKPSGNRIRDLEKAGALIAAEIDRLRRRGHV